MIIIIIICILCSVFLLLKKNKRAIIDKSLLKNYFTDKSNPLYKFILSEIDGFDKDLIGTTPEMSFYITFEDFIINDIHNKILSIERENILYFGYPLEYDINMNFINNNTQKIIEESFFDIMNNDIYVSKKIYDIFYSSVHENNKNAYEIEQKAILYNESFGKEPNGDPKLHPEETKTDTHIFDDIHEKSIEELLSIGTVEDIKE